VLVTRASGFKVLQRPPQAFQRRVGQLVTIPSKFGLRRRADGSLSSYDKTVPLVIDLVLSFSTYKRRLHRSIEYGFFERWHAFAHGHRNRHGRYTTFNFGDVQLSGNGPPSVHIDTPSQGATVSGTITVGRLTIRLQRSGRRSERHCCGGWKDGRHRHLWGHAHGCMRMPGGGAGSQSVGFTFQLNTATLASRSHKLTVSATDGDRTPDTASASVTVVH
jgi:hypothetical protein